MTAADADRVPEADNLMSIGRFSSLSQLSVRMLRHYDANGVLVPAHIDEWTGYRRYAPHQLIDALAVRNLRDAGFGVSAIGALLTTRGTPAWTSALQMQRQNLIDEGQAIRKRLVLLDRLPNDNEGESNMSIAIDRVSVPAMTVVALRDTVPTYADERLLWERLMPELAAAGIRPAGACGVIEHDDEYTPENVDLSIFVPVTPGTRVEAPLHVLDLPARDCLVAHVRGPYEQLREAHDLISVRLGSENLAVRDDGTVASHAFNRYLTTMDEVREDELITEVYQPLA